MVIINTSADDVSIQAVSPLSGSIATPRSCAHAGVAVSALRTNAVFINFWIMFVPTPLPGNIPKRPSSSLQALGRVGGGRRPRPGCWL